MKWLRFYTEVLDDPKMAHLKDDEYRAFTYLLGMAAEEEKDGFIPRTLEDIAWRTRLKPELLERTVNKLIPLGIITNQDGGYLFINWRKRQFKSDDTTERVHRYRTRKSETFHETFQATLHETPPEQSRTEQNRTEQNISLSKDNDSQQNDSVDETKCPHQEIIKLYHEILPTCRKIRIWDERRQIKLRSRWKEDKSRQSLEWWKTYFKNVSLCFWFTDKNERSWYPNLEWLIEKRNMVNVLEKKYYQGDR